ncbi:MAG: DUF6941 family protein [Streptosporangiaceae bacterium]
MELLSAMVADAATAFNGKLYVHGGGWDALVVREFPADHPAMALALILCADSSEAPRMGELRVQLVDEDGNDAGAGAAATLGFGHNPLHKAGQKTVAPVAIPFEKIRFEKPGQYEFRIFWNGDPLNLSASFSVTPPPLPTAGKAPASPQPPPNT